MNTFTQLQNLYKAKCNDDPISPLHMCSKLSHTPRKIETNSSIKRIKLKPIHLPCSYPLELQIVLRSTDPKSSWGSSSTTPWGRHAR